MERIYLHVHVCETRQIDSGKGTLARRANALGVVEAWGPGATKRRLASGQDAKRKI
jgi:hypothetical protein